MNRLFHLNSLGRRAAIAQICLVPAAGLAQSGPTEGIKKICALAVTPAAGEVLIATDCGLLRADSSGTSQVLPGPSVAVTGLAGGRSQ